MLVKSHCYACTRNKIRQHYSNNKFNSAWMFLQINCAYYSPFDVDFILANSEGTKPFLSLWVSQIIVQFSKRGSRPFTRTWTERECGKKLQRGIRVWGQQWFTRVWGRLSAGICSHLDFQRCNSSSTTFTFTFWNRVDGWLNIECFKFNIIMIHEYY